MLDVIDGPFIESPNPDMPLELVFDQNNLQNLDFIERCLEKGLQLRRLRLSGNRLGSGGDSFKEGRIMGKDISKFH